jgi:hypothetical protein
VITAYYFIFHLFSLAQWFGFGFSMGGSMESSDIVIGWINDDETGHFSGNSFFVFIISSLHHNNIK